MIGFSFTFLWLTFCLVRRKVSLVAVICGFLPPYRTRVPSFSHPPLPRGAHLMRFTIITFRLQVLRQGGVTVCGGVCGHLNCNLRRQSGVSSVALVRVWFLRLTRSPPLRRPTGTPCPQHVAPDTAVTPGLHTLWPPHLLVDTNNHTLSVDNYCC